MGLKFCISNKHTVDANDPQSEHQDLRSSEENALDDINQMRGRGKSRKNPSKRESQLLFEEKPPQTWGKPASPESHGHLAFWVSINISNPVQSWSTKQKGGMIPLWSPHTGAFQMARAVKNLPANVGDIRDTGSIPGWGRSPGGGYGNPLQGSCLENPMDRGAWRATVHRVSKTQTQLKQLIR